MRIDIITLFPDYVEGFFSESILKRAREQKLVELVTHDLRDWAVDAYGAVDGHPYGGGAGMVLRCDVVVPAIEKVRKLNPDSSVILLTPQGQKYNQVVARELSKTKGMILVCGRYEGFDERIREYVNREISVGDYVLSGGELAAGVIIDSVVRLLPGALGDDFSSVEESFSTSTLEYPQYTRPEEYEGKKIPPILLSGHHAKIEAWRKEEATRRTKERRPDLS